jgi:hypothetical protein
MEQAIRIEQGEMMDPSFFNQLRQYSANFFSHMRLSRFNLNNNSSNTIIAK